MKQMRRWIALILVMAMAAAMPIHAEQAPLSTPTDLPEEVMPEVPEQPEASPVPGMPEQPEALPTEPPALPENTPEAPEQPEPEETPAIPEETTPVETPEPTETPEAPEQPEEPEEPATPQATSMPEEDVARALTDPLKVELHTGTAYGGNGMLVDVGREIQKVFVNTTAAKYFSVKFTAGKTFRIYPIKRGNQQLTIYYTDGTRKTVKVTIYDKFIATELALSLKGAGDGGSVLYMTAPGAAASAVCAMTPSTATNKVTWKSSNKKIAAIDAQTGAITLLKEGTVTLTATADNGVKKSIKVQVVDPYKPKSVVIKYNGVTVTDKKAILWSQEDRLKLSADVVTWGGSKYPAKDKPTWTSDSRKLATIDENGTVTILKAGTVTFTAKAANGVKATVKFRYVTPLKEVTITPSAYTEVAPGKQVKLKSSLTPSTSSPLVDLVWSSADEKIATVSQKGVVTGVTEGVTYIYCKDRVSGITARKSVVVSIPANYRAVLVVESTIIDTAEYWYQGELHLLTGRYQRTADMNMMVKMLQMQNYSGRKWSISKYHNTSASKTLAAVDKLAAKANDHDVTMFFFMGHGGVDGTLYFHDDSTIRAAELKQHLDAIPGKVVVILGNCYSGSVIAKDLGGFTSSVIRTFGVGDTVPVTILDAQGKTKSLTIEQLQDSLTEGDDDYAPKRGELRQSKYYVLTAASADQLAWSAFSFGSVNVRKDTFTVNESKSFSYFVRGICRAGGWDGIDKKTLWSNDQRTLAQVYNVAREYCSGNGNASSSVQVYPSGSGFVLFRH